MTKHTHLPRQTDSHDADEIVAMMKLYKNHKEAEKRIKRLLENKRLTLRILAYADLQLFKKYFDKVDSSDELIISEVCDRIDHILYEPSKEGNEKKALLLKDTSLLASTQIKRKEFDDLYL